MTHALLHSFEKCESCRTFRFERHVIKKSTLDEPLTSIKEHNINVKESYAYVFHCLLYNTFRSIEVTMTAPKNHGILEDRRDLKVWHFVSTDSPKAEYAESDEALRTHL